MKYFVAASLLVCLSLSSPTLAEHDADGDWQSSTLHFAFGVSMYDFKPLGDNPAAILPGAPTDWTIEGGDLAISIRGKAPSNGMFYGGGGGTFMFGLTDDDYGEPTLWEDERYGHVGADIFVELGLRLPVGTTHHLDFGGRLGGTFDYAWGSDTAFSYYHAHLWYGPVITFEPNGGLGGFIVSGSLRLPAVGSFGIEDIGLDEDYDVSSGSTARLEAGFVFSNGFSLVGFYETGGFEYDDNDSDESFDQDSSGFGVELRLTH